MRFTQAFLAALSAAAAQAVIITNADFSNIQVGVPFVITYSDAVGPVTVYLGSGSPTDVVQGAAVGSASGATGSITWTPTSGGSYALKIQDAGAPASPVNPNYSGFFNVAGPVVATTASTTAAPSTTPLQTTTVASTTVTPIIGGNSTTLISSTSSVIVHTNTTVTSGTSKPTGSSSSTSVPTQVPNSMASGFASPIAFVLLAVGALLTFN